MLVTRTRLSLRDEMKCNAQPCESCWLVADLKLLCPHSLRSSRSPSPPLSLPLAPTAMLQEGPFSTTALRSRPSMFKHRTALRAPDNGTPPPAIDFFIGRPSAFRFSFRFLDVVRSSGFHLRVRCAPRRVVSHLHPCGGRCLIQRSDAFIPIHPDIIRSVPGTAQLRARVDDKLQ